MSGAFPLRITVENADELLNVAFLGAGALLHLERSATGGGAGFSEIATAALVSGTRVYLIYDTAGTTSSWYRWRATTSTSTLPTAYSSEFQVADEAASQLCSLYDVKQQLDLKDATGAAITTEDENILEAIRAVSAQIMGATVTGRQFARTPSAGTTTFLFDIAAPTRTLWVPEGIATITQVEVAAYTGAAFAIVPTADWFLGPARPEPGWTYTRVVISDLVTGSVPYFFQGMRVVRLTGALGWPTVPDDIARIARTLTVAALREKGASGGDSYTINLDGSRTFERSLSYSDRMILQGYKRIPV